MVPRTNSLAFHSPSFDEVEVGDEFSWVRYPPRLSSDEVAHITSDNGYYQGEHRVSKGKFTAYEESIRVPLGRARMRM